MSAKDRLLNNLPTMLRQDEYINELCQSLGIEIDAMELLLQDIYNNYWFDTMTWGANIIAKQLGITLNPNLTQAEIDKAKPCHLLVDYIFNYLLVRDIDGVMTLNEVETLTLDKFAWD